MSAVVVATAVIDGPEARGTATLERNDDGRTVLRLTEYWIAPGAPDVHVYLTPSAEGDTDVEGAIDFGKMTQLSGTVVLGVPANASIERATVVVVLCKVYSVEFGRGTLVPETS